MGGEPLGPWASLSTDELYVQTDQLRDSISPTDAWKALRYGAAGGDFYDELAERIGAASPYRGQRPFVTLRRMLIERATRTSSIAMRRARRLQSVLQPRALDLPANDGTLRFEVTEDELVFFLSKTTAQGLTFDETWTLGRSHPPSFLHDEARASDAPATTNQSIHVQIPGAAWLPLATLIDIGRFDRNQDVTDRLVRTTDPGTLYLFISHRWARPDNPDPDGAEASVLGWQFVDFLCEAIIVAARRGLAAPRASSPSLNLTIGLSGRELSEAVVVNVLRHHLDAGSLPRALEEATRIEEQIRGNPLDVARSDPGMQRLREAIAGSPIVRELCAHLCIWYDFASLPQPPRTPGEEAVFQQGLRSLAATQLIGRTVILLDQPEAYLGRAWCTLEALSVNALGTGLDIVHAIHRPAELAADASSEFEDVAADRLHLVRRAVLDTILFQRQTPERCFERLGIAVTDPADIPLVFGHLARSSYTGSAHIDSSAVVTGTLPLPQAADGRVALLPDSPDRNTATVETPLARLDWHFAISRIAETEVRARPSHETYDAHGDAHVVVIAGCEGDAGILADWVRTRRPELEAATETKVAAISWLAEDIVPVGHMPFGRLEPVVSRATTWVVVCSRVQLDHGYLAKRILAAAAAAGKRQIAIAFDQGLILDFPPALDTSLLVAIDRVDLTPFEGGVFAAAFQQSSSRLFERTTAPHVREAVDLAPPSPRLQEMIITWAMQGHADRVATMCQTHPKSILDQFESWLTVPEPLRDDEDAVRSYANAVIQIAQVLKQLGYPRALALFENRPSNPIQRLYRTFRSAGEHADASNFIASSQLLEGLLVELGTMRGPVVADIKPKVLGMLAANLFKTGALVEARAMNQRALDECIALGDRAGIEAYTQNFTAIDLAAATDRGPVDDIARAQALSDLGRYEASIAILEALPLDQPSLWPSRAMGLIGANHHWLGNAETARRWTQRALDHAIAMKDIAAERTYRFNLEVIARP